MSIEVLIVGEMWGFVDWFLVYGFDDFMVGIRKVEMDSLVFVVGFCMDVGEEMIFCDYGDILLYGE